MLKDIHAGKINMVITCLWVEITYKQVITQNNIFLLHNVRYIAVNDGVDTLIDNNDIAPFKNILNDIYAKDLSRKVKLAKRCRVLDGLFISLKCIMDDTVIILQIKII